MTFISNLWSVIFDFMGMFFTPSSTNPFPYLIVLIVISFVACYFVKKVIR